MRFNPFGSAKVQKIETTIASLAKRADQLAAKRAKAQEALEKATSARQQALLAGDLDDQRALDKLQAAVDTAGSALTGIDDALAILARQKAEAESALAVEREHVARAVAADRLEKAISAIEAAAAPWLEQSRIYADALSELSHWHFGCDEMAKYLLSCMGQIETAANFHLGELKAMPQFIRDGRQDIPADKPKPAPIANVEPPPATQMVFMIRSARYLDHDGKKRFAGQYEDAIMPVPTAQKAIRLGVAVTTADPRRATHRGARGSDYRPDAIDVVDIDTAAEHTGIPFIGPDAHDPATERSVHVDPVSGAEFVEFRGPARVGLAKVS